MMEMNEQNVNEEVTTTTTQEVVSSTDANELPEGVLCTNDEIENDVVIENILYPSDEDLLYPEEVLRLESDYLEDKDQEDKLWKARTGLDEDTICGAIETIIFMNDKPVSINKIKGLIDPDMPLRVVHSALERLQDEYEQKHHGIRLQEVAMGYQFRTKATYSKFVQDLFKVTELVLSPTALEVLAIIAYKQPISKVEVEKIRGVDSSHIVRGLMDKRLVKVVGRSEEVGKPVLYGTTQEFLEVFNLANVDQLPPEHELEEIAKQGVGKISDIKNLINADIQSRFGNDEIEELDKLSVSIKSVKADTPFTKSLKVEEKKRGKEGEVVKTAFELLEEYLDKNLVSRENKESVLSEVFTAINDVNVIHDLTDGPFNVPEEEAEEEFEMIDLDTGLPITDEVTSEEGIVDVELEGNEELEIELSLDTDDTDAEEVDDLPLESDQLEMSDSEEVQSKEEIDDFQAELVEDNKEEVEEIKLLDPEVDEAKELAKALDQAFSKLMGGDSILDEMVDDVELSDDVDEKTAQMVEDAKDLDLDLSFLNHEGDEGDDPTV